MIVLPHVIGHRGAAAVAPENTLAGIRAAAAAGAAWVEFDIRVTADGVCILQHDESMKRTAGCRRKVASMAYADIAQLDVGAWFSPRFAGETPPRLSDVLDELDWLDLGANIEIKADPRRAPLVAESLMTCLADHPAGGRVPILISSLDERMLDAVRKIDPDAMLGLLLKRRRRNWRALAERLGCVTVHCRRNWIRQRDIDQFRAAGYGVAVFTVNDPRQAVTLIEMGVDAVFSDRPGDLLGPVGAVAGRRAI